jgi:hypothetical protein
MTSVLSQRPQYRGTCDALPNNALNLTKRDGLF